jgi:hypothetical protein
MELEYLDRTKPTWLASLSTFKQNSKGAYKLKDIKKFLHSQDVYTRTLSARRNFPRRKIIAYKRGEVYQADLMDCQKESKDNDNMRYILVLTDTLSKMLYLFPLKDKKAPTLVRAFKKFLKKEKDITHLNSDKGTDFYNRLMREQIYIPNKITHYSTRNQYPKSAPQAERAIRYIRRQILRWNIYSQSNRWIEILPIIETNYNHRIHSVTKMRPVDITKRNESEVFKILYPYRKPKRPKFKVGTIVRIQKLLNPLEKRSISQYTVELFKVKQILNTEPVTYMLKDEDEEEIKGGFYECELVEVIRLVKRVNILKYQNRAGKRCAQVRFVDSNIIKWIPVRDLNDMKKNGDIIIE